MAEETLEVGMMSGGTGVVRTGDQSHTIARLCPTLAIHSHREGRAGHGPARTSNTGPGEEEVRDHYAQATPPPPIASDTVPPVLRTPSHTASRATRQLGSVD